MEIRAATKADLAAIQALSKTTPWEKSEFLRREVDLGHVSVALERGIVRGFVVWNHEFFEKPFIWLVVVDRAHRRNGTGGKLFESVEARCAGSRLYTSTNRSNNVMAAFLKSRGYCVAGELDLDPDDPEIFYRIDVR